MSRPIKLRWRNKSQRGAIDAWARLPTAVGGRLLARTDVIISVMAEVLDITKTHVIDLAVLAMMERINMQLVADGEKPVDIEAWSRESAKITRKKRNEYIPVAERAKGPGAPGPRKRARGRKGGVEKPGGQGGGVPVEVRSPEAHQGTGGG